MGPSPVATNNDKKLNAIIKAIAGAATVFSGNVRFIYAATGQENQDQGLLGIIQMRLRGILEGVKCKKLLYGFCFMAH